MLQVASLVPATKSKTEIRALGARERMFWFVDQKQPVHLAVTAEVKHRCHKGLYGSCRR